MEKVRANKSTAFCNDRTSEMNVSAKIKANSNTFISQRLMIDITQYLFAKV